MTDAIMVGARGWDHAAWSGGFYPVELPDDWRFCYYSNNLRSALVPQSVSERALRADVDQWITDSDPEFRFVFEVPAPLTAPLADDARAAALGAFLDAIAPAATRTAGLLLRIAPDTPVQLDWFEHLINDLAEIAPLCVDLPARGWRREESLAAMARQGAGLAWHCRDEAEPHPGGHLLVALAPSAGAREVRTWIEKISAWQHPGSVAGIFFDETDSSAKTTQEARLIAELMGV